MHPLVGHGTV